MRERVSVRKREKRERELELESYVRECVCVCYREIERERVKPSSVSHHEVVGGLEGVSHHKRSGRPKRQNCERESEREKEKLIIAI